MTPTDRQRLAGAELLSLILDDAEWEAEWFRTYIPTSTPAELLAQKPYQLSPAPAEPAWTPPLEIPPPRAWSQTFYPPPWVDREGLWMAAYGFAVWLAPLAICYLIGIFS
jgi:hypothetical protein